MAAMKIGDKNAVFGGYYDSAGGGDWYGKIAGCEVVTMIMVRWPEADQRLSDSGPKLQRR